MSCVGKTWLFLLEMEISKLDHKHRMEQIQDMVASKDTIERT